MHYANPFLRLIVNHHLNWFNMTESCKQYTILQCIWKPCRHYQYRRPMSTFYFWRPSWIWHRDGPKHNFNTKNGCHPEISGIRGITLVSVLHWSKSWNSTNPRCYFGGHLEFGIKMTPSIILTPETDFST